MSGEQVCVAALDEAGHSIRPLPEVGGKGLNHLRSDLRLPDGVLIRPKVLVTAKWRRLTRLHPPHVEDVGYEKASISVLGALCQEEFLDRLKKSCDSSVGKIYGKEIEGGPKAYVSAGIGSRSLGTVRPIAPPTVSIFADKGEVQPRLRFETEGDATPWDFRIVDLALLGYARSRHDNEPLSRIESGLNRALKQCQAIYLRLGLARPFKPEDADWPKKRCYVMLIGIHTQPDYLQGRCWADF